MKDSSSILVLLVALFFGVYFTVPADDVPETPYDESEVSPFESTPLFAIVILGSGSLKSDRVRHERLPVRGSDVVVKQGERAGCRRSISIAIVDRALRC